MKKVLGIGLLLLLALAAVLLFRAQTVFDGEQYEAAVPQRAPAPDLDAASRRLAKALRFPTISYDDPAGLDETAFTGLREHIAASFSRVHALAQPRIVNQHSLLYFFPGTQPDLKPALFMGHLDVVPVDAATLSDWRHPPFSGVIEDGVIWGRGVMDDKVTVFALLEAMELLLASGAQPDRGVYFAFGHDEEVGGPRGAAAIAELLESEGVSFEFVLDEGGVITRGVLPGVSAAVAMVGVAEKGFANFRLTVNAEGGHSSQPPDTTAVGILSQAIVNLEANQFPSRVDYTLMTLRYLGEELSLGTRLAMGNLWLFEPLVANALKRAPSTAASTRSTIAATMLEGSSKSNILPTRATAVVNVRILPGDSVESVRRHFVDAINDSRVDVEPFMANEPSRVSPTDSLGYQLIAQNIRGIDDSVLVAPYLVQGGTDSKHFYALSPNIYRFIMVRADAETIKRVHGVNEQLSVDEYGNAIVFFRNLLRDTMYGTGA